MVTLSRDVKSNWQAINVDHIFEGCRLTSSVMSRSVCQEETQKNLAAIGKAIAAIEKGLSGAQRTQCQRTLWTRDTKFHGIS